MDIVYPNGNEKELIEMAKKLGIRELILVYDDIRKIPKLSSDKIQLKFGILNPKNPQAMKGKVDYVLSSKNARASLENPAIKIVFDMEKHEEKDFTFQRNSGLNEVLCAIAKDKDKIIGFNFSNLLNTSGFQRIKLLARIKQNIELCRKYKVQTIVFSFARNEWDMRAERDMKAVIDTISL